MKVHYRKSTASYLCGTSRTPGLAAFTINRDEVTCQKCLDALVDDTRRQQHRALWADKERPSTLPEALRAAHLRAYDALVKASLAFDALDKARDLDDWLALAPDAVRAAEGASHAAREALELANKLDEEGQP